MEMEITDTIQDINEKEWDTLVGANWIERSHKWYRTIEDSGMRKMHYVFLRENGTLTAATCCYLFKERIYSIEMPLLEVKSPLGTSLAFFSKTPEQAHMLVEGLEEICKKEKAKGFLILDLRKEEVITIKEQVKGFAEFQQKDNTYIDLDFADFEDYLNSLDEESWRSARMTLNRAKRWKIKTVFTNEFSTWKSVAKRLQKYVCEYHNDYRMFMTEHFYSALEKNVKENTELIMFFKDDIPLASALVMNMPNISIYKGTGADPDYRKYQAYFLFYYEGIKKALERGQKRIYYGTTTYEFKEKIGCKREELFGLAKMANPVLHLGLKSFITVSKLWDNRF